MRHCTNNTPNLTNQIRALKYNSVLRNASNYAKIFVHTVLMFTTGDPVNVPRTCYIHYHLVMFS